MIASAQYLQNASLHLYFAIFLAKVKVWMAIIGLHLNDPYTGATLPRAKQDLAQARSKTNSPQHENRRSVCPIACTLDLLGDKWTLLVVRDLMHGKSHFKEFLASPEKIATNILAERLARLTANGLVERYPSSEIGGRDAYQLTEKGRSLRELMAKIKNWGLNHIDGTEARL